MASIRDRKRERWLLVLLVLLVGRIHEATHTALDLIVVSNSCGENMQ